VSGGDTQQSPPPPPPPRSGSPFGRFLTSPILVVALIALAVSIAVLAGSGGRGPGDAAPVETPGHGGVASTELQGVWTGPAETADGTAATVRLTIRPRGGRLRRGGCRGSLQTLGVPGRDRAAFAYTEQTRRQACPAETRVTVRLEQRILRIEETLDGAPYLSGVLTRAG
jgi:hypothetical protein